LSKLSATRRHRLVLALVACLAAATAGVVTGGNASASPTTPTSMVITKVSSAYAAPSDLPPGAEPSALVKANELFTVRVEFFIGTTAASFSSNTNLKISSTAGTLSSATGVAPAGKTFALLTTSITKPVNRVGLTVTVANGPAKGLSTGTPTAIATFDVLSDIQVKTTTVGAAFTGGIGGDTSCATATPELPVCGIVQLPRGAGASVLLSVGLCDTTSTDYAPCFEGPKKTGGAVIQTLFAQPATPYSTTSPAILIVKCDKTLCGTGAIKGLTVQYSLAGNGALTDAGPCPGKNTMPTDPITHLGVPCVDYVQSTRDGSGDTHLYLLTDRDLRGGIG
jgi:hypothetical protein